MGHGYRPVISKIRVENPNKSTTKIKNYNLLHYIATREGVDLTRIDNTIEAMIDEKLDLNEAGEDIVFKDSDNEEYLKYIAHRPRSHGLFGNINTERFEDVAKLLNKASEDKKCVYRGIVSLSELDAEALGYNNVNKWNLYLKSIMPDIAEKLGLSPNDITWVAAFHAEQKHPHVHYMLWDNRDIVRKAYVHVAQQEACREICQNAMFTDENEAIIREITAAERKEYYGQQNASRQEITSYIRKIFVDSEYIPGVNVEKLPGRMGVETHKELNELYKKVLNTMPGQGRMAYKYMPMECKAYIDRISEIFLKQPDIKQEYHGYMKAVENIHRSLGKTKQEIAGAKEYAVEELQARIGNIVLNGIWNLRNDILDVKSSEKKEFANLEEGSFISDENNSVRIMEPDYVEINQSDNAWDSNIQFDDKELDFINSIKSLTNKKSEEYNPVQAEKRLLEKLEDNAPRLNKFICKKLGELYSDNNSILHDYEKALYYLEDSISYEKQDIDVHILLGKIYGDEYYPSYDISKSEENYLDALKKWEYLKQKKASKGKSKKSKEEKKYDYLKLKLSRMYADSKSEICDYDKALDILQGYTDYKGSVSLQRGNIYSDENSPFYNMENAITFYEESARRNNEYGAYNLGKICTDENSIFYDLTKGIDYLEQAAGSMVIPAHISLGKIYLDKERGYYNVFKAYEHLSIVKNKLQEKEQGKFSKLSKRELETKAQVCMYLGKIYTEKNELHNYQEALIQFKDCINSYEKAGNTNNVILNNSYIKIAQIFLDKEEKYYHPEKAEEYLMKALYNSEELLNQQKQADGIEDRRNVQYIKLQLNRLYMDEESPLWNLNKAMSILQDEEDEKGFFSLKRGDIYANEKNIGYDMPRAIWCYTEAAEKGNTIAMIKIAQIFSEKGEKYYHPERAEEYLIKALHNSEEFLNQQKQTQTDSIEDRRNIQYIKLQLNKLYMDKESPLWNLNKAMSILQDEEDEKGFFLLKKGDVYANEKYAGYDMSKAVWCYVNAAGKENTTAMVKLAKCYLFGMGVDKDKQKAIYWFNKAADAGDEYAKEYMKKMDAMKFNNYSYAILRQIFSSMKQTKDKGMLRLQETEFKVKSKQAKKEEYLHHN